MSYYIDSFADDLGPEKVVHIYEPKSKLRAIVVIDNISLGPAIGGCRMARDVSTQEVFRLARAMTLKNALAQLPHGGAKSALLADPGTEFCCMADNCTTCLPTGAICNGNACG